MRVTIARPLAELVQCFEQKGRAPTSTLQVLRSERNPPSFEVEKHLAGAGFAEWRVQGGEILLAVFEGHRPQAFQNLQAVIARREGLKCQLLRGGSEPRGRSSECSAR
ncbi:hypothetical protein DM872_19125 [Pseudomonas taiwanensis]|nr:hypothetical protein [Pseudomonas taiwanensis]